MKPNNGTSIKTFAQISSIPQGANVYLYGAGKGGDIALKILTEFRSDIFIAGYIDTYASGKKNRLDIFKLHDLNLTSADCLVLITSEHSHSIRETLEKSNVFNYMIMESRAFGNGLFSNSELEKNRERFIAVKKLLHTASDRNLFDLIIDQRSLPSKHRNEFLSRVRPTDNQYFDFIIPGQIRTIIEGGVFDGKNTFDFVTRFPGPVTVYGFDPLIGTLTHSRYFDELESVPTVHMYPLALWNNKDRLNFFDNQTRSQVAAKTGNQCDTSYVDAISIDEFVMKHSIKKIDFIKMDIEGAEVQALEGAVQTMTTHRPQLAISIYHHKNHLLDIPINLDHLLDDYIFKLGHYHTQFLETILYAIPREIYRNSYK